MRYVYVCVCVCAAETLTKNLGSKIWNGFIHSKCYRFRFYWQGKMVTIEHDASGSLFKMNFFFPNIQCIYGSGAVTHTEHTIYTQYLSQSFSFCQIAAFQNHFSVFYYTNWSTLSYELNGYGFCLLPPPFCFFLIPEFHNFMPFIQIHRDRLYSIRKF